MSSSPQEVIFRTNNSSSQNYSHPDNHTIRTKEGIVVSESDTIDQEIWNQGMSSIFREGAREMVRKRREVIHWKAVREAKRKVMEQRFLKRRRSKKVSQIFTQVPEVGKEIETFVIECGAVAETWRRTAVITFDGSKKGAEEANF